MFSSTDTQLILDYQTHLLKQRLHRLSSELKGFNELIVSEASAVLAHCCTDEKVTQFIQAVKENDHYGMNARVRAIREEMTYNELTEDAAIFDHDSRKHQSVLHDDQKRRALRGVYPDSDWMLKPDQKD